MSTAGQIELVSCQTVTATVKTRGKKRTVTRRTCTTKLVSGTVTFAATQASARLTRGGALYATGTANQIRLVLHTRRPVHPGRYTLILRHRDGRRTITNRRQITIA